MASEARRNRQVQQLEGRVVKVELGDTTDAIVLYYDNGLTDKYIIELSLEDYLDKSYEPMIHLGIQRITPPFGVYNTMANGRASRLISYLFDHELVEFIAEQGGDGSEWYRRISNGDRFYFGVAVNNVVVMRTKEES